MKSILQNSEHCFLCGDRGQLETHHIFFGNPGQTDIRKERIQNQIMPGMPQIKR